MPGSTPQRQSQRIPQQSGEFSTARSGEITSATDTLCHLVEGYVVAPLVQRRILDLPPALTLLSMTVLGSLFGLPGIILGTPLAAVVLILVQSLYVGDVLGDHEVDPTRKR